MRTFQTVLMKSLLVVFMLVFGDQASGAVVKEKRNLVESFINSILKTSKPYVEAIPLQVLGRPWNKNTKDLFDNSDRNLEFVSSDVKLLSNREEIAKKQKAQFQAEADVFIGQKFHSGYVHILKGGGEMFYWYFPCRNCGQDNPEEVPFIIWLTGGPGCSSELAALTENGPFNVGPDVKLTLNAYSWNEIADVVYVDQPLGTGFSVAGDPRNFATNETTIAADIHGFLTNLIEIYPNLKNRPFYITGESYAGHYIPAIAYGLVSVPIPSLDFKGIAIGNGWVSPREQYPAYAEFGFENGMISQQAYELAQKGFKLCSELIDRGLWPLALIQCNSIVSGILGKKNPYDIRLDCEVPPLCYNTTALNVFMNKPDVQARLGVHRKWEDCNSMVYVLLLGDWVETMSKKISVLLESGIRVLIYSGDKDFICNWRGGQAWVDNVDWDKKKEFAATELSSWKVGTTSAGEYKTVDNLTFLRIYNAGHMVPMDQPEAALAMLTSFLHVVSSSSPPSGPLLNSKKLNTLTKEKVASGGRGNGGRGRDGSSSRNSHRESELEGDENSLVVDVEGVKTVLAWA